MKIKSSSLFTLSCVSTAAVLAGWFFFQKYVLSNLENSYFLYSPRDLIPSIYVMIIITILRYCTYSVGENTAKSFASKEITASIPAWCCNKTITQNNIDNMPKPLLTDEQIHDILDIASKQYSNKEFENVCQKYQLTKHQMKDLKHYAKAKKEYDSNVEKYQENVFKLFITTFITLYGCYVVLIRENFFWQPASQWACKVPPQPYDAWITNYYVIALGYHFHRTMFQFVGAIRKDFWVLFVHHWATIALISISWLIGFMQTGSLIMFLHDNGDFWLSLGKLTRYNGWNTLTDIIFGIFAISWFIFRLYWYPTKVLYSIFADGLDMVRPYPYAWVCITLLCVLQIMHIYWFSLIIIVIKNLTRGGKTEDIRSEVSGNENNDKHKHND